jgi:uncharacterized membrane protein
MQVNPKVTRLSGKKIQRKYIFDLVFIVINLVLTIVHAFLALGKFEAFNLYGTDLALFDQVIWNTLHGRLLENTVIVDAPILLAQRFSPILFAFVPLYALWQDARVLVVTPVVAIGIAAFPLYWIARQRLGRPLALVSVLAFWTMPGLQPIVLSNFKEIILTVPFLMMAMFFLLRQQYQPFLVSLGLALLCKEEVGLVAAGLGLYIFLVQHRYALGGALTVFGLLWTIVLIQVVIPYFHGGASYYYFGVGQYSASGLYEYLGTSVPEIVATLVTRPLFVLSHVLTPEKIDTLAKIFLPYAILGILGAENLFLALPTLAYTLLSERRGQYIFGSEHYAPVYVFLAVALVMGAARVLKFVPATRRSVARVVLGVFIVVTSAVAYYLHAPGPLTRNFVPQLYTPSPRDRIGMQLAKMIPQDVVVTVQSELASHVAQRRYLYMDATYPCLSGVDYAFADVQRPWYTYREPGWQAIFQSGWFAPIAETDGYRLYQRLSALKLDVPLNIRFGDRLTFLGYSIPITKIRQGGDTLHVLTGWIVTQPVTRSFFRYSVYDRAGHLWIETIQEPCRGIHPTDLWKPDQINYDDVLLRLPPTMPSGDYVVTVAAYPRSSPNALLARDSQERDLGTEIEITSIPVIKNKQSFTASDLWIEQRYFVDMGEMRLLGFKPIPAMIQVGQALHIGLYWRARAKPQGDYQVIVQLRDANGNRVVEHSDRPAQGTYPTTLWDAGEVLLDWHDLQIPRDTAQGTYQIVVILKEYASERILGEARIGEIRVSP